MQLGNCWQFYFSSFTRHIYSYAFFLADKDKGLCHLSALYSAVLLLIYLSGMFCTAPSSSSWFFFLCVRFLCQKPGDGAHSVKGSWGCDPPAAGKNDVSMCGQREIDLFNPIKYPTIFEDSTGTLINLGKTNFITGNRDVEKSNFRFARCVRFS